MRTPLDAWTAARLSLPPGAPLRGEMERVQLTRLRETLAWAARKSPFYRDRLARLPDGWPDRISDLAVLPFTTAEDLREQGERLVCVSQDELARVVTLPSSGTTGPPKRIWFTAPDQESIVDFFAAGMSTLVGTADRVLILLPGSVPGSVGALLEAALRRRGVEAIAHGFIRNLPLALDLLRQRRPTSAVGPPAQILALARFARAKGVDLGLSTALLTTDHVPCSVVRALREEYGCESFEHYGMTELGLGAAVDCRAHQGCHLRELDLLCEVIEPSTGAKARDGEVGELVFTTLGRHGMPLIRYRTGDLSSVDAAPCPCGSSLRRVGKVFGRVGALVLEPGGRARVTLQDLDEALYSIPSLLDFSAETGMISGLPALRVRAYCLPGRGDELALEVSAALARLAAIETARAAGRLHLTVVIRPAPADPWPRNGKRALAPLDMARLPHGADVASC